MWQSTRFRCKNIPLGGTQDGKEPPNINFGASYYLGNY